MDADAGKLYSNAAPCDPPWADAIGDQEWRLTSGLDSCVFVQDVEAAADSDDGVMAELDLTVRVRVTAPLCEIADAGRNALAAAVLLYDVRNHGADANQRAIILEK